MCGIAGIVSLRGQEITLETLQKLMEPISHRGPDGVGYWFNANRSVALGHRRLAVIDVSKNGQQPMKTQDDRFVITYNGEIYNFLELRQELELSGRRFYTQSDTEVILAAWQEWGESMLSRFNGMWALAIFDTKSNDLFFARDRFGIKPFLYSLTTEYFLFASEMKALLHSGLIAIKHDKEVAQRLLINPFGIEGSNRTFFEQVHRLQGGHYMRLRDGKVQVKRWWRTVDHLPQTILNQEEQAEKFSSLFEDAVALRMRSDVPIGTCLSGGFDSSAILCTMSKLQKAEIGERSTKAWRHAFVASFPGMSNDELPEANIAAAWAGVIPNVLTIGKNDALENIDRILSDLDDVYISLPTAIWLTYQELRRNEVFVSLDGHGADEMMGGYRQKGEYWGFIFRNFIAKMASGHEALAHGVDLARMLVLKRQKRFFLRGKMASIPPALSLTGEHDVLPEEWGGLNRRLYHMFHGTVLPTILRNFDRLSMAHGIEIRMPFMDWRLVTYVMSLPDHCKNANGYSKLIARRAMSGRMPDSIRMGTRKVGFNSPMPEWLNNDLNLWVKKIAESYCPAFSELVDERALNVEIFQLSQNSQWNWSSAGRLWPYINLKWWLLRYS